MTNETKQTANKILDVPASGRWYENIFFVVGKLAACSSYRINTNSIYSFTNGFAVHSVSQYLRCFPLGLGIHFNQSRAVSGNHLLYCSSCNEAFHSGIGIVCSQIRDAERMLSAVSCPVGN